jgi:hypothetical protein
MFIANLDLDNIKVHGVENAVYLKKEFKSQGMDYNSRTRVIRKNGNAVVNFNLNYLGGDDKHGPNYTGQDSVTSHYTLPGK